MSCHISLLLHSAAPPSCWLICPALLCSGDWFVVSVMQLFSAVFFPVHSLSSSSHPFSSPFIPLSFAFFCDSFSSSSPSCSSSFPCRHLSLTISAFELLLTCLSNYALFNVRIILFWLQNSANFVVVVALYQIGGRLVVRLICLNDTGTDTAALWTKWHTFIK